MRKIVAIFLLALSACQSEKCIHGVLYYESVTSYTITLTPLIDRDGKPLTCGGEETENITVKLPE